MIDPVRTVRDEAPRRSLFRRLGGTAVLGLAGLVPAPLPAQPAAAPSDGPSWPGKLTGRHRQVVDGYDFSAGRPLEFAYTFLSTNPSPGAATVVIVLRSGAFPFALNSAMWAKYRIGESFQIIDPETHMAAVKNPFLHTRPGILRFDGAALDRLLASGAVVGACDIALHGQSKVLSGKAGVSADEAAREFAANLVPGVTIIPSGTWGVNRAQEAGCTYCAGG